MWFVKDVNMKFEILDEQEIAEEADILFEKLFPICRSITGEGVRETLSILNKTIGFDIHEIKTGTKCYDWEIPNEWNINDAYVKNEKGLRVIDFKKNNLHLVSYSIPVNTKITFSELERHLNTLPNLPDAIPYRTSYYNKDWGFCISHDKKNELDKDDNYHVVIDSTLKPGSMTYGEKIIKGTSKNEFLFSSYCCHPSMGNDNLSGLILWILLLKQLEGKKLKNNYRFVTVPETIGSIYYLSSHETQMKDLTGGFVLTCTAGPNKFAYKKSFLQDHFIDKISIKALKESGEEFEIFPFDVNGSDERQYSSPYFRIPIGTISRDKYFEFPFYHTSKDNLEFISGKNLVKTLKVYLRIIESLEEHSDDEIKKIRNRKHMKTDGHVFYKSLNPYCEPMLSKRGLYPLKGGMIKQKIFDLDNDHSKRTYNISGDKGISGSKLNEILWVLFYTDSKTSIQEISKETKISLERIKEIVTILEKVKLIKKMEE